MKNLSIILNIILLIAVAVLYFLHFKKDDKVVPGSEVVSKDGEASKPIAAKDTALVVEELPVKVESVGSDEKIAYINLEEFFDKYEFYRQGVKQIERSIDNKKKQLLEKQKQLEEDFQTYQQTAPTLSENYRKTKEQQLLQQEQELYKLRDELEGQQANELTKFNEKLLKKLDDYLENLSKEKNFSYVFTYSKGNPASIVYARDSLDITKQVLKQLNKEYKK